jgi:uncharacterized protein YbjT (DUF2867 family)
MFVVAGVTGNTGSVVAESLLSKGRPVRVIVRDEAKGAPWRARGAEVAVASVDDPKALAEALAGAKRAYGLVPPDLGSKDPLGRGRRIADAWATAIEAASLERFVFLSSVGAQHAAGTGMIRTAHASEKRLREGRVPVTFVRAASFVENWATGIGPAQKDGILPTFEAPETRFAQVATRDIGVVAAAALEASGEGHRTIELAGPEDLTPTEIASILGDLIGRPVRAFHVPEAQVVPTLTSFGISAEVADLFREMAVGIERGHVDYERNGAEFVRGTTTAATVLRALLPK